MDLGKVIAADKPAEFEVKHPVTGAKTGVFITVFGKHSGVFRDRMNNNIDRKARQAATDAGAGVPPAVQSFAEQQRENEELLAACTAGWRDTEDKAPEGKLSFKGKWLDCNFDNAVMVYSDHDMRWLREQVNEQIGNLENFTNG